MKHEHTRTRSETAMFRPLVRSHRRPPRRGTAILITCFFLITIMMVTALALVMYAARERAAALAFQDGATAASRNAPPPENTANQFLGALIYDAGDDGTALQNALRGHSIARSMYGSRPDYSPPGTNPWIGNTTPWNGVGTFHEQADAYGIAALNGQDRGRFVNYTGLSVGGQFLQLDPEWTGNRPVVAGTPPTLPAFAASVANRNYVSKAAGYTYPDLKNFWLGARDPATGEVLVQSFHRDSLFAHPGLQAGETALHPNNPNWGVATVRGNPQPDAALRTLRPRPAEHPSFPRVPPNADGTYTGDVQNLPGSFRFVPGRGFIAMNDSLWMHIGLPPITLSDGRRVQPMVAPLILPLDGSFDLSHHGSEYNAVTNPGPPATTTYTHISYSGQAPWEINLSYGTATTTDSYNLLAQRKNAPSSGAREFNPYVNAQLPATGQRQLLPRYAPVSWSGALVNFRLPSEQLAADNAFMLGLPSSGNPSSTVGGPFGGFQNDNGQIANHPAGYNSNDFGPRNNTSNLSSPVYPWTDLKRSTLRYAYYPDWYSQAFVTKTAPTTFQGNGATFPYFANPTVNLQSNYRLDPAHARRGLFVPRTMSLERPALSPTFLSRDLTNALSLFTPTVPMGSPPLPGKPGALVPPNTPFPDPALPTSTPGEVTDFAQTLNVGAGTTKQWYNFVAALGSVNLNRPLADYRDLNAPPNVNTATTPPTFTPQPLSAPGNMLNAAAAEADRQALAKDIFARLIIATGAAGQVSFDATNGVQIELPNPNNLMIRGTAYTPEQYNALRYLAQVAVNIVDYIDNDDISTTFVWNPSNNLAQDMRPANLGERVVFGVEKPRLVLNEVYSEITNDPADPVEDMIDPMTMMPKALDPKARAHVKFWAELVNPTSAPHALPTGVLGTGAVNLSAYQIQIARANRATGGPAEDRVSFLSSPANPNGLFGDAMGNLHAPDATFTFNPAPMAPTPSTVSPNDVSLGGQQYAPPQANLPAGGFVLVGPPQAVKMKSKEFTPPNTGVWAPTNQVISAVPGPAPNSTAMGYTITMPGAAALSTREFKRHVVLLRRLANPYLPPDNTTNPYITVDVMDYVPSFDAVHRAAAPDDKTDRGAWDATNNPKGYDPVANRFSVGKVQPLAGLSFAALTDGKGTTGGYNVYNGNTTWAVPNAGAPAQLTTSMVRDQTAAPTLTPGTDEPNEPKNTFGRHNGNGVTPPVNATVNTAAVPATLTDTIQFPFDWLIHMDRPLETQGELFFVRDCPPHRLTTEFAYPVITPPATAPHLDYTVGTARWTQHSDGLARALELLTVKSPKLTDAHGGRVGGKVNPNVMQDSRIAQGVWDPQASNRFDINFVTNTVWNGWMNSRSPIQQKAQADGTTTVPVPVPSSSVLDQVTGGVDRPFMPYGGPTVPYPVPPAPTSGSFAYTAPNVTNDGDTILRRPVPSMAVPSPEPYLVLDPVANPTTVVRHPYTQTEPLRKVMNNLTPVSHTFVVYFTIGYFEVSTPAAPANWPSNVPVPPQFGVEVYDQIPGDMRQKYIAVIDMSNLALKANPPAGDPDPHATVQPFFTALAGTARPGANVPLTLGSGGGNAATSTYTLSADGQTATIRPGDQLVLGYGAETQPVAVNAVGPLPPTPNPGSDPNYPLGLAPNQIGIASLTRTAWGGTCVSNVRPGYAGPRPTTDPFNFTLDKYKPVVPYVERLR